jgi:hypothetical protein
MVRRYDELVMLLSTCAIIFNFFLVLVCILGELVRRYDEFMEMHVSSSSYDMHVSCSYI